MSVKKKTANAKTAKTVTPKTGADALPYEELVAGLEATLERLESGDLSLEEALAAYEQGAGLANQAQALLDRAEQRIQELQELDAE